MNNEKLIEILVQISQILSRCGEETRVADIQKDIDLVKAGAVPIKDVFLTRKYWGGSGSYLDLILDTKMLADNGVATYNPNKAYNKLLSELLEELHNNGVVVPNYEQLKSFLSH